MRMLLGLLVTLIMSALSANAQEEIRVGAVLPMTGEAASYGAWWHNGLQQAADEINAGWQGRRKITLFIEDGKSTARDSIQAMQKLISINNVSAVMTTLSGVTRALSPIAEEKKIILTTGATLPGLTEGRRFMFRNATNMGSEISQLVQFAAKRYKRAAILSVNLDWANWGRDAFIKGFTAAGGQVVETQSIPPDANDVRAQLVRIRAARPDVVVVLAYKSTGVALKQAREIGLEAQFVGTLDFELPEVLEIAKEAANGAVYTKASFDPHYPTSDEMKKFVDEYRRRYGDYPQASAATAYDMLKMLAMAISEAGGDAEKARTNLLAIKDFRGATGLTTFLPNGDVEKPVDLKSIKNGKYIPYKP